MSDTTIDTRSGISFDFLNATVDDILWIDIAIALGKICRFGGHCIGFYSVAQHSCLVADILPLEIKLYGLLHDAHEAYIGDMTKPFKRAIAATASYDCLELEYPIKKDVVIAIGKIENKLISLLGGQRIDELIYEAAGIPSPNTDIKKAIHEADMIAFITEYRDLMPTEITNPYFNQYKPLEKTIKAKTWEDAQTDWHLRLYRELIAYKN